MEKEGLFSTVVGSFPLENTEGNMAKAFKDEINIGIDYPCYPQLEGMNPQFLTPLSEVIGPLDEKEGVYTLNADFKIPEKPVALKYGEFIVNFLKDNPDLKDSIKGTKACLTGPFTLASEVLLGEELGKGIDPMVFKEPRALRVDWIIDKFAEIMKGIGKAYNDMGINIISMDEPMLSLLVGRKVFFHSEEFIIETLNKALSGIKGLSSIHVCGRISPKLRDLLLQTDVKILDHEFRTNEGNFKIFQKEHFQNTDKYIAMGTVETKFTPVENGGLKDYVEEIDFLKDYISKGIEHFGKENLVIKPDCGFGPLLKTFGEELGYNIVINKLKNLVSAVKQLK